MADSSDKNSSSDSDEDFELDHNFLSRRKRCRLPSSSEDGDSDSDETTNFRIDSNFLSRRKRRRISSESSDASSSSSSIQVSRNVRRTRRLSYDTNDGASSSESDANSSPIRHRRTRPSRQLISGTSSSDSEVPPTVFSARTVATVRAAAAARESSPAASRVSDEHSDSGSGDEGLQKCPICLGAIRGPTVASPESCDHGFCFHCLETWSKNGTICPMDRLPFHAIVVKDKINGRVVRRVSVEQRSMSAIFDREEGAYYCLLCGGYDREDEMLLCDGCDRGFHLDCLSPPLQEVPQVELWFCPTCITWNQVTQERASEEPDSEASHRRGTRRRNTFLLPRNGTLRAYLRMYRQLIRTTLEDYYEEHNTFFEDLEF